MTNSRTSALFVATIFLAFALPGFVYAGSQNFTSSGTFTVPAYSSLTVTVNGGGGGAGGAGGVQSSGGGGDQNSTYSRVAGSNGSSGSGSSFNGTVVGNGGGGGGGDPGNGGAGGGGGAGGASGGDTNTTGGGAGGGGAVNNCNGAGGLGLGGSGAGGAGGQSIKTYSVGGLTPGAGISVVVGGGGGGGGGGAGNTCSGSTGGSGVGGSVSVTWSDPVAPTVTTSAASSVTTSGATLNGAISATGGQDATQSGFAYSTNSTLSSGVSTSTLGAQSGTASFNSAISSLSPNTTYYFRAYATNPQGTSYGTILNFTTGIAIPSVTTLAASSVTTSAGTLNASITATGGQDATQSGFAYSTNSTLSSGVSTSTLGAQSGTASFNSALSSLSAATTYYFRAYAANGGGTGYGSILNFTTGAVNPPSVTTSAASGVTNSTATLNGSVTATNGADSTEHGFAYSTNAALSSGVSTTTDGAFAGTGSFSDLLNNISANATYYFRAYSVNSAGTSFGTILNFSTSEAPARRFRLFEGFTVKILNGTLKLNPN